MLSIRLQRVGRKHEPVFRLVLTDSKNSTKSGRFLEILGSYDSRKAEDAKFNNEKILHWISKGAQTSATVNNLLITRKLIEGKKRNVLSKRPSAKASPADVSAEAPASPPPAGRAGAGGSAKEKEAQLPENAGEVASKGEDVVELPKPEEA